MAKLVKVCIGYAQSACVEPRYQVIDECGPLRMFWTKEEAKRWMQPYMRLVVLPKPKREPKYIEVEEAWL
jgi:hypothetical protein